MVSTRLDASCQGVRISDISKIDFLKIDYDVVIYMNKIIYNDMKIKVKGLHLKVTYQVFKKHSTV